jgi:hypothetical protein
MRRQVSWNTFASGVYRKTNRLKSHFELTVFERVQNAREPVHTIQTRRIARRSRRVQKHDQTATLELLVLTQHGNHLKSRHL